MKSYEDVWPENAFDEKTMQAYKRLIDDAVIKLDVIIYGRYTGRFKVKYMANESQDEIHARLKRLRDGRTG
ncbi:MAG: hypothetical protein Q4D04_08935 [Clostridia bacterium]|nr:hypothetical protein [Clostridia bacterium]